MPMWCTCKNTQIVKELPVRSVVKWNALIAGYTKQGQRARALKCYDSMVCEGHSPNAVTFTYALKACGSIGAATKGEQIHVKIISLGLLEKNFMLGNAVVDMYAKCGALVKAQQVFRELLVQDAVTWNALIAGYVHHRRGEEALILYDSMQSEGHLPNIATFTCALKACGEIRSADKGQQIHEKIVSLGLLDKVIVLGNTLVGMYAKCGALAKAQKVLEELSVRDVVTWNALISGYAQQGQGEDALRCYNNMEHEGYFPNAVTFTCALKACGSIRAAIKGEQIHEIIVNMHLLETSIVLGNALVDMYSKCGLLAKAQSVFEELLVRDVVSWNALITGYVQQGREKEALKCFDSMQCEGHFPNEVTFTCALKACGTIEVSTKGQEIHDMVVSLGMLEKDVALGNALVGMYARCGALAKAQQVLEELSARNLITWNTLIVGYVNEGQHEEALKCYDSMQSEAQSPDVISYVYALKACGSMGAAAKGVQIHLKIVGLSLLEKNALLGNALVEMYAKCGALAMAERVLKELPVQTVIMWNAVIAGYVQQGQGEEALKCYDSMLCEGQSPDVVTFIFALKACGAIRTADKGKQIHEKIIDVGLLEKSIVLGNALVDMYAKCGALHQAQQLLKEIPFRDAITWNSLIAGYAEQGQGEEALKCYDNMQCEGHPPDAVTFISALKACGSIGAADKGEEIHQKVISLGIIEKSTVLGNTLVNMYARCGLLAKAQQVLEELPVCGVISWSALIGGSALQGQSLAAVNCFEMMQMKGVAPDSTILACVLNAFSHSGLCDRAEIFFATMRTKYKITPDEEHYCCMIDLFSRAGRFRKALEMTEKMPYAECPPLWTALLGACRNWGEVKIGRLAFEHALHFENSYVAIYVCMADIYTAAGMQEDADNIEIRRAANMAWKLPGCCWWTDGTGKVHSFLDGDKYHAQNKWIYLKLEYLAQKISQEGYFTGVTIEDVLSTHSEKLAVACALISTPPGTSIFVVKNMRVCMNCHAAMAVISKIENRQIKVRDANVLHIFENGKCSCGVRLF